MADAVTDAILVFSGADNESRLELRRDNVALADHSAITRIVLTFGTVEIDSDVTPAIFDLTETGYVGVNLGGQSLRIGRHYASIKTYDAQHPNGEVWGKPTLFEVL